MKILGILLLSILLLLIFMPRAKPAATKAVGRIGGVSVSVPRQYQFFPITYKGEDIWSGKHLPGKPTLDTPISTISLLVRLTDMSPETPGNRAEREKAIRDYDKRVWVDVQIEGHGAPEDPWAKAVVERIKDYTSKDRWIGWKYEMAGSRYGLTEELLVGGDKDRRKKRWGQDKSLMYDEGVWSTYIQCDTNEIKYNMRHRCRQSFSLKPKINAHVYVEYDSINLKDWKIIQERLSQLIYSFVKPETAK